MIISCTLSAASRTHKHRKDMLKATKQYLMTLCSPITPTVLILTKLQGLCQGCSYTLLQYIIASLPPNPKRTHTKLTRYPDTVAMLRTLPGSKHWALNSGDGLPSPRACDPGILLSLMEKTAEKRATLLPLQLLRDTSWCGDMFNKYGRKRVWRRPLSQI
ncbi:hypothetical protein BD779DRAFT_1541222 [Infundibulicybe gibba]|nr:hypothetical protein BD779DRAFT_1541222 [Infundibulicybe gibba]